MLRVNNGVLVVPPFECAWLTGDGYTLRSGSGCLSFEAKGDTDVTVILKSTPGAKRLQPLLRQVPGSAGSASGGNALQVEQNYTIIFGSHRNSCLKIEKNGVTQCMVTGVACSRVSSKDFSKYWIDLNHGVLTVGHGEPGQGICHQWRDVQEIPGIQHIGLSCWDRHVSYRSISLQAPLDFTRLQQTRLAGGAADSAVPSLFDATCAAIMAATTPTNVCRTLHVAELLLPTTQKLYRHCLDFIARHLETVVRLPDPPQHLRAVSPAAMCDMVCQNTFSVDERGIFSAVHDWACSYIAAAAAEAEDAGGAGEAECFAGGMVECTSPWEGVEGRDGGMAEAGERNCVRRLVSPPGGSPRGPSSPLAPAGHRPRMSEPSSGIAACASAPAPLTAGPPGGGPGGRRSRTPSHHDFTAALDLVGLPSAPATPVRPPLPAYGAGATATVTGPVGFAEEAACRVLSLIRFPLLPIEQLHACLGDPLLLRLPPVLELVNEALEVHRRETGAGLAAAVGRDAGAPASGLHVAGGVGGEGVGPGVPAAAAAAAAANMMSPSSGRRLVKPLLATAGGGGAAAAAVGPGGGLESAASGGAPPAGGVAAAAAAGGAAAATASDSCWSVRYQRRCLPFALELMYVCDGDSCGVLHFLGTSYGSQGWVNPMLAKRVDVRASSPTGRTTDPRVVLGRQFVRTNFAGPRYVNGAAVSWWQVDLGEQHQLVITYYTLRHDGSQDFVRSWVLQGSHDLATWVDLKRHAHDTTIKVPGQYASWPVIGPAAAVPYRAFRLLLTAPNASPNPASRHNFCLSNLELYGFLHKGTAGAAASGAAGGSGASEAPAAVGPCSGSSSSSATDTGVGMSSCSAAGAGAGNNSDAGSVVSAVGSTDAAATAGAAAAEAAGPAACCEARAPVDAAGGLDGSGPPA